MTVLNNETVYVGPKIPAKKQVPWKNHSQNCFLIKTEIKPSQIEGGGQGRYAAQACKKDDMVMCYELMTVKHFLASFEKGTIPSEKSFVLQIENEEDLDKLVDHFVADKEDFAKITEIRLMLSWFVFGFVGSQESEKKTDLSGLLCSSSLHYNHSTDRDCLVFVFKDGKVYCQATRNIQEGEELFMNYHNFRIRDDIKKWLNGHGLTDAHSFSVALDG